MHDKTTPEDDRERRLLREIGGLSDRVRKLRETDAAANETQIKALERQSRTKWEELRALRAAPMGGEPPSRHGGGLYR